MNWLRQVLHVALKDLRQSAWPAILVVLSLVLAVAHAMGVAATPAGDDFATRSVPIQLLFGGPLFYLAGALLTVWVVQSDSPARSDAFWVTRPLSPGAVLVAKVWVIGTLLLLFPLGAQFVAVLAHGVEPSTALFLVGRSALIQAGFLGALFALAALTTDLRSYLLTLILAWVGWGILKQLVWAAVGGFATGPPVAPHPMLVQLTLVLAGAAVATLQYRTRNTRRTLGIVVPPLVVAIVVLNAAGAAPGGRFAAGSSVPEDLRARDVRGHVMAARPDAFGAGRGAWSINVELTLADARAGYRYTLHPSVSLELQDGSSHTLHAGGNTVRLTAPRPPVPGVRWRDPELSGSHLGRTNLSVTIPGELMEAVRTGGTRLVFGGRMEVAEPHPVEALPLRSGATGHEGQRTFGVLSVEQVDGAPIIQMQMDGVGPDDGGLEWSIREDTDLTLLDRAGAQAAQLRSNGRRGESRFLVLAGVEAWRWESAFVPAVARRGSYGNWWEDGQILITEWRALGSYDLQGTSLEVTLPR